MSLSYPWIIIIAVYACCFVLLVCDVALLLYLCLRPRCQRKTETDMPSSSYLLYPGFKRIHSQHLYCSLHPGRYQSPVSFTISEVPLSSCCPEGEVDILVNIQRGPLLAKPGSPHSAGPSHHHAFGSKREDGRREMSGGAGGRHPHMEGEEEGMYSFTSPLLDSNQLDSTREWPDDGGVVSAGSSSRIYAKEVELLGWDNFYSDTFSVYVSGSPLYFNDPGSYKVQAYVVYGKKKKVSMVHQWVFDVEPSFLTASRSGEEKASSLPPLPPQEKRGKRAEEERKQHSADRKKGEKKRKRRGGGEDEEKKGRSSHGKGRCSFSSFTSSSGMGRDGFCSDSSTNTNTITTTTTSSCSPPLPHRHHQLPMSPFSGAAAKMGMAGGGYDSNREYHPGHSGPSRFHQHRRRHSHSHHRHHSRPYSPTPELAHPKPLRGGGGGYAPSYPGSLPGAPLPPPRIVPDGGVITSITPIHLHSALSDSGNVEEFRYSTDGSYPSLLYTGPFQLNASLTGPKLPFGVGWGGAEGVGGIGGTGGGGGGGAEGRDGGTIVVVKAISLSSSSQKRSNTNNKWPPYDPMREWGGVGNGMAMTSGVAEAIFRVVSAPTAFFDPVLPSPSLHVRALDAALYFDMPALERMWDKKRREIPLQVSGEAVVRPGTSSTLHVFFQCYAVDMATRPDGPPPLDPSRAQLYRGVPVVLPCHLTRLYAWTVIEGVGHSAPTVYEPGKEVILEPFDASSSPQYQYAFLPPSSSSHAFSGRLPSPFSPQNSSGREGDGRDRVEQTGSRPVSTFVPPLPSSVSATPLPLQPPPFPPPSFSLQAPEGPLVPPPLPPPPSSSSSSLATHSTQSILASARFLNPFIPSPVVCVSCKEIELCFADPPANTRIAYTLNRTEPTLTDVSPPASAALPSALFSSSSIGGGTLPPQIGSGAYSMQSGVSQAHYPSSSPPPLVYSPGEGWGICGGGESEGRRQGGVVHHASAAPPPAGPVWAPDRNGLHTFFYESGKWIRVSLLEPEGLHVTARIFKPVFNSGGSTSLCRGYGCNMGGGGGDGSLFGFRNTPPPQADTVHTTTGGMLVGYRFSSAFHRGFYYQEKTNRSPSFQ